MDRVKLSLYTYKTDGTQRFLTAHKYQMRCTTPFYNMRSKTGEWPATWTQILVITLPEKGNLQLCQNYRSIILISHPSKGMLRIILNRLQSQAEEIFSEEQAGFSGNEQHRTNIQSQDPLREISSASAISTMSS